MIGRSLPVCGRCSSKGASVPASCVVHPLGDCFEVEDALCSESDRASGPGAGHPVSLQFRSREEDILTTASTSYSEVAEREFRRYLQDRYASIGELNFAWGGNFWALAYYNFVVKRLPCDNDGESLTTFEKPDARCRVSLTSQLTCQFPAIAQSTHFGQIFRLAVPQGQAGSSARC